MARTKQTPVKQLLKEAAKKRGYLQNNFGIWKEGGAWYIASRLNNIEKGIEQCEQVMRDCGYTWQVVKVDHPILEIKFDAYKIITV